MLHRSAPFRQAPDEITRAELEAIGLGDPSFSLRRLTARDLFAVGLFCIMFLFFSLAFNLGDIFHMLVMENEYWRLDEFVLSGVATAFAFGWFS